MQDFYGDTPFIIGNKKQKGRRKRDEIQPIRFAFDGVPTAFEHPLFAVGGHSLPAGLAAGETSRQLGYGWRKSALFKRGRTASAFCGSSGAALAFCFGLGERFLSLWNMEQKGVRFV